MHLPAPPFDSGFALCAGLTAAYLAGCFNTGYYLVRWKTGQDLRTLGSGNAGSKNTGRILGSAGFALTLLGDMLKGALVLSAARWAGFPSAWCVLALIAVTAGHNWPVQLGFRGGKGLATSFGALLVFDPFLAGLMLGGCAMLLAVTRRFTFSATLPYALCPAFALFLHHDLPTVALLAVMAALVIGPHLAKLHTEFAAPSAQPRA